VTKSSELLQGTLDLLILKVLTLEPMHGWAIAQRIHQLSHEVLIVNQGALYPALHRLEHQAWIEASWGESENNRRAKYYHAHQSWQATPKRRGEVVGPALGGRSGRIEGNRLGAKECVEFAVC
jgi:PadR family transcriptional regulator, regulatory protein PadR